jgi:hypothetical protein
MTADIETVKELMSVSAGSVDSTKKAMTAAQDMARAQQSGGGEEGKAKPRPVQSPEELAQALAAANAKKRGKDPGDAQATAQENPKKFTAALVDDLSKKSKVPPEKVNKVLSALIKANKLKTTFKVVEEGVSREHSTLSASDVYRAQRLYLESGGSSRRWVDLLLERDVTSSSDAKYKSLLNQIEQGKITSIEALQSEMGGKGRGKQRSADSKKFDLTKAMKKNLINTLKEKTSKGSGGDKSDKKNEHSKFAEELKSQMEDLLNDVAPKEITAVLDALPPYLMAESRRRRLVEARRVKFN